MLRTSALTGMGVGRVVPSLLTVHEAWTRRVSTSEVNRVLEAAVGAHPPPRGAGRIHYATQVSAAPPTFVTRPLWNMPVVRALHGPQKPA